MVCPVCSSELQEFEFKHAPGIKLNGCPQCKGIWADEGELDDLYRRMHPQAAGIDIGGSEHWVAIAPDRDAEPIRCFDCFTGDLEQMADWTAVHGEAADQIDEDAMRTPLEVLECVDVGQAARKGSMPRSAAVPGRTRRASRWR